MNEEKKIVDQTQREYFEEPGALDDIPVMRLHMEGYPDLILNSSKHIYCALEETFLGENEEWWDFKPGTTITITFEEMPKAEFDALEPWEI